MNSLNWFERRKLKKNVNWFAFQIKSENIDLALHFYESKLKQYSDFLSKEIRIIYYYYKWYVTDDDQYFEMIEVIKIGSNLNGSVLRIEEMQMAFMYRKAAWALKNSDAEVFRNINNLVAKHGENSTLRFSIVLLQFLIRMKNTENKVTDLAELNDLLSDLPDDVLLPETFINPYYQLLIVLLFKSGQYAALLKLLELNTAANAFDKEKMLDIKKTVLFRQWKYLVTKNDIEAASDILNRLNTLLERRDFRNLFSNVVIGQLDSQEPSALISMLEGYSSNENAFPHMGWNLGLNYLQILTLLRLRRLVGARNQIDSMIEVCSQMNEIDVLDTILKKNDLLSHLLFLKALSFLNETTDWYVQQKSDNEQDAATLGNLSLWKDLSKALDSVIEHAIKVDSGYTWKQKILSGLILFVNPSISITNEHIEDFRNSIDNISSPDTRQKLLAILGELVIRSKATEEAIDYIKKGNFVQLLELFNNVIRPQGNSIPVLIRISVILTLWEKDHNFNALDNLIQIKNDTGEDNYIDIAIQEVKIYELIKRLEQNCIGFDESESLPSMEPLKDAPQIKPMCEMAIRVIHLKHRNWAEAKRDYDWADTEKSQEIVRIFNNIQVYCSWNTQDNKQIAKFLEERGANSFTDDAGCLRALKICALIHYVQSRDKVRILPVLNDLISTGGSLSVQQALLAFPVWLLEHKHSQVLLYFLEVIRGEETFQKALSTEDNVILGLVEGMALAELKQYNLAGKSFQSLGDSSAAKEDLSLIATANSWSDLFQTYLDLIGLLNTEKDIKIGWSSLKRRVQEQAEGMKSNNMINNHLQLILCLLSFIDDTRIIEDSMLMNFQSVARDLVIRPKTPFLEGLLRNVILRKKIIEDFWKTNSLSDFHTANKIFESELVPMFRDNMPYAIQIVKVMIDWNLQNKDTGSLIARLDDIQNRYPEANPEFIKKVRNYINDSNRILELSGILVSHDFENAVKFIQKTEWEGYDPGSMPVQVAIALLFSYYKLQQNENAQRLGHLIANSSNLAQWVRDYGNIMLGYVCFENKMFGDAANAFEKISQSIVKGHNVNRYWAASYFSIGLQYIGKGMEGKENEAFDAFARAMSNRGASVSNLNLSPLFFHIGLLNLHSRNGTKALASFKLASQTIEGIQLDNTVSYIGATAAIGESVCRMFLHSETISNGDIDESRERFKITTYRVPEIVYNYCILQIVIYFRSLKHESQKIRSLDAKEFLVTKIRDLEAIQDELKRQDPVLFIFKAIYLILFDGEKSKPEARKLIGQALALGIHSDRLNTFVKKHLGKDEQRKDLFEAFILYLTDETVNETDKEYLLLNQPFREFSKLNKGFVPDEIVVDTTRKTTFDHMVERLKHLEKNLAKEFKNDKVVKDLLEQMKNALNEVNTASGNFTQCEEKLLNVLVEHINQ